MYEELQVGLDGIVTPERMDVILDSYRQLTEAGMDAMNDELLVIFNLQDGIADNSMLVSRVTDCLMAGAVTLLKEHGIFVRPETIELPQLTALIQTVIGFDKYLLPESLWTLVAANEEADVILASLVPLFSDISADEILPAIERVEPALIARMRELTEHKVHVSEEATALSDDHNARIASINTLLRHYDQKHPSLVKELADAGVPSGQTLVVLFEQVFAELDNFKANELGIEFLGLVLYSDTPLCEVYGVTRSLPQEFTDSHSEQYRIEHAIDQAFALIKGE